MSNTTRFDPPHMDCPAAAKHLHIPPLPLEVPPMQQHIVWKWNITKNQFSLIEDLILLPPLQDPQIYHNSAHSVLIPGSSNCINALLFTECGII